MKAEHVARVLSMQRKANHTPLENETVREYIIRTSCGFLTINEVLHYTSVNRSLLYKWIDKNPHRIALHVDAATVRKIKASF